MENIQSFKITRPKSHDEVMLYNLILWLMQSIGGVDEDRIHYYLFLADKLHRMRHAQSLYNETWIYRDDCITFGYKAYQLMNYEINMYHFEEEFKDKPINYDYISISRSEVIEEIINYYKDIPNKEIVKEIDKLLGVYWNNHGEYFRYQQILKYVKKNVEVCPLFKEFSKSEISSKLDHYLYYNY